MFFRPPKVKSISRYAEYGAYLGNTHFLLMLAIAFTVHIAFIVIYSMTPNQDVIRIPVRPLNIKLSGGGNPEATLHMPAPSSMPAKESAPVMPAPEEMKTIGSEDAETVVDDAIKEPEKKSAAAKKHPETPALGQIIRLPVPPVKKGSHGHANTNEASLATPKRYVRETAKPVPAATKTANVGGEAGGKDAVERYTQVVSQWIKNHQSAARSAYKEAMQGQEHVHGQAVIRLRIDRDGHILFNSVDHTSGNELVDEVAIATVRASDPVPSVPGDYPSDSQLEFLIAVEVDFAKQ